MGGAIYANRYCIGIIMVVVLGVASIINDLVVVVTVGVA
jgi:hypothetical protein